MMKNTTLLVGTAALLTLAGTASAKNMMNARDAEFVAAVGHGNTFEVQSSKLALTRTSNPDVLMVANRLIKDHGTAQADLQQSIGMKLGVPVPSAPDAKQKAMIAKLRGLRGTAFDKAFMPQQVKAHDMTVALFKKELQYGGDSNVRGFASKYLAGIQDHTIMIHNVASNVGANPAMHHDMKMRSGKM